MYLFYILNATLHVSNDYFIHHQEFINLLYLQLCTNHENVPNCSVVRPGTFIKLYIYNVLLFTAEHWAENTISVRA
jgi:hypothetical protein